MKTTVDDIFAQAIDCFQRSTWCSLKVIQTSDLLVANTYLKDADELLAKGHALKAMLQNGVFFSLN